MVEEQLEQRTAINTLQEEIKCEILENRMILQNILKILTAGPLTLKTDQTQEEKPKQRLKRKDIKNMWLDVNIAVYFDKIICIHA